MPELKIILRQLVGVNPSTVLPVDFGCYFVNPIRCGVESFQTVRFQFSASLTQFLKRTHVKIERDFNRFVVTPETHTASSRVKTPAGIREIQRHLPRPEPFADVLISSTESVRMV